MEQHRNRKRVERQEPTPESEGELELEPGVWPTMNPMFFHGQYPYRPAPNMYPYMGQMPMPILVWDGHTGQPVWTTLPPQTQLPVLPSMPVMQTMGGFGQNQVMMPITLPMQLPIASAPGGFGVYPALDQFWPLDQFQSPIVVVDAVPEVLPQRRTGTGRELVEVGDGRTDLVPVRPRLRRRSVRSVSRQAQANGKGKKDEPITLQQVATWAFYAGCFVLILLAAVPFLSGTEKSAKEKAEAASIERATQLLSGSVTPGNVSGSAGQKQNQSVIVVKNASGYNPLAAPSIQKQIFVDYLARNSSPAGAEAAAIYDALVAGGADPAVALGFFYKESSLGKFGVANQTKSWGNIRCTPGYQCQAASGNGSFRSYGSWTAGAHDWTVLMKAYASGSIRAGQRLVTLEQILPVYAPSGDRNDPVGYIAAVKKVADELRKAA